jgi:hypothetical protein
MGDEQVSRPEAPPVLGSVDTGTAERYDVIEVSA